MDEVRSHCWQKYQIEWMEKCDRAITFHSNLAYKILCTYNVFVNELAFDWDESKAKVNVRKHGVSFVEAPSAFYDENARLRYDYDHSIEEEWYIL